MTIGYHYILDIYGCEQTEISFVPAVERLLHEIIGKVDLVKVNAAFKQFEPKGVTGFILLEESHISIHTWPEHSFAAIDIFSCKSIEVSSLESFLLDVLKAEKVCLSSIRRGKIPVPTL